MNKGQVIIDLSLLERLWGIKLPIEVAENYGNFEIQCEQLDVEEFRRTIEKVINVLKGDLVKSGSQRKTEWNLGWGSNLENFKTTRDFQSLGPGYFEKSKLLRLDRKWVSPISPNAEQNLLHLIVQTFAVIFLKSCSSIHEFGCGTGHNLIALRKVLPNTQLVGLDWVESSQLLVNEISATLKDSMMTSKGFNFFEPDFTFDLPENSGVLTVAALEQTGENFIEFVNYLLAKRPSMVLNVEPIGELLDENDLLDFLSLEYFKKRNYLAGYLDYLRKLETQGKIQIVDTRRTFIGSMFIDGYSVCAWKPI